MMGREIDWYRISFWLALVRIGLALYLLYEKFAPAHQSLCYLNSYINCEASTKGPLSSTLGIPTPLYGLIGYIVIALAAYQKRLRLFLAMALFGLVFCLRITYLEVFVAKALCPVCLTCQTIMIVLAAIALKLKLHPS